jgi:hypothetical protein
MRLGGITPIHPTTLNEWLKYHTERLMELYFECECGDLTIQKYPDSFEISYQSAPFTDEFMVYRVLASQDEEGIHIVETHINRNQKEEKEITI